jgi:ribonucleotide reductase beta subunit family protein with ferritin-like domain
MAASSSDAALAVAGPVRQRNPFTLFPVRNREMWDMYQKALASFWTAQEVDLSHDAVEFNTKLNDGERYFIKHVLAFFAGSDGIVNMNIDTRFSVDIDRVNIIEAKFFYHFQLAMEDIHNTMYSLLIDTLVRDEEEKAGLLDGIRTLPCVSKKAEWAIRWSKKDASFPERLLAFVCVEGIQFSGSFCAIFWLKNRGVMPGLCFSNELISRDEGMHTDFAIQLLKTLARDHPEEYAMPPQETAHAIFREAVDVERDYVCNSLPVGLLGMNADSMSTYVEYVADRLLVQAGYARLYGAANPFDFMAYAGLDTKSNFFEKRVAEYFIAGVHDEARGLSIDTDSKDF